MSVRAKFDCTNKEHDPHDPRHGSVTLQVVYADRVSRLIPAVSIPIATLNPESFALFEQGKSYFVDFQGTSYFVDPAE